MEKLFSIHLVALLKDSFLGKTHFHEESVLEEFIDIHATGIFHEIAIAAITISCVFYYLQQV